MVTPLSCKMVLPATLNLWLNGLLAFSPCGRCWLAGQVLTHAGLRLLTGLLALGTGTVRCRSFLGRVAWGPPQVLSPAACNNLAGKNDSPHTQHQTQAVASESCSPAARKAQVPANLPAD